jgi:hypothetical protein
MTLLLKRSDFYLLIRRTFNQTFRGEEVEDTHADRPVSQVEPALQLTEDAVAGLAKAARQRGIPFAVLLITVPERVIPAATQQVLNARFAAFAERAGIPLVDLAPQFAAHRHEDLYYTVHWTPHGHAVVAQATAEFLQQKGLLSAPTAVSADHH